MAKPARPGGDARARAWGAAQPAVATQQLIVRGPWQQAIGRFCRNKLAIVAFVVVAVLLATAIFAPFITPYRYDKPDYDAVSQPPSWSHLMGTDVMGRDLFSRVIYGARVSITVGVVVQLCALLFGLPLGGIAGYYGGWVDYVIMRIVDALMAFPRMLTVMLIMVALGPGLTNVLIALGLTSWLPICRLARGQCLSLREKEFVLAARSIGAPDRQIVLRHLLANALSPIIVAVTLGIPAAIVGEAGLSFIGIGVLPPMPSWGQMVGEYYKMIQSCWHLLLFPALTLGLTTLSFTLLGDGLQEALTPSARR